MSQSLSTITASMVQHVEPAMHDAARKGALNPNHCVERGWCVKQESIGKPWYLLTDLEFYERMSEDWFPAARRLCEEFSGSSAFQRIEAYLQESTNASMSARQIAHNVVCLFLLDKLRGQQVTAGALATRIREAVAELNEGKVSTKVLVHLTGVRVTSQPVSMKFDSGDCTIRGPLPEDVAEPLPATDPTTIRLPFGVAELEMPVVFGVTVQNLIERLLGALRLFGVGGVDHVRYFARCSSVQNWVAFNKWSTVSWPQQTPRTHYYYEFDSGKAARWPAFLSLVESGLRDHLASLDGVANSPWSIAFARYSDALSGVGDVNQRIALAIMALEAMLSESANSYRLAMRSAALLGCMGVASDAVAKHVRSGYRVRNSYVHGDKPSTQPSVDPKALSAELLDYARKCLAYALAFQHGDSAGKCALIKSVDEYLLMHDSTSNLVVHASQTAGIV